MGTLKVNCLRSVAVINGKSFPMFAGFLSPIGIKKIANVPNFARMKPHFQIAHDISNPPVDQWQRPLDEHKTEQIKQIYSSATKHNLMANPVLLGTSVYAGSASCKLEVKQLSVPTSTGQTLVLDDLYTVEITYEDEHKPLWILDGQHRIEGMAISVQKEQPMPFVLLHSPGSYTPAFLAEIFTQVTTGATPMEELHAEWMKFAFELDDYSVLSFKKAMNVCIHLCKENAFSGTPNPFQNKIQFNPYMTQPGFYAFKLTAKEWVKLIADHCYSKPCALSEFEVAGEVVKAIRAFESIDISAHNDSKLFSDKDPHKILAEAVIVALLRNIATINKTRTFDDWKSFFLDSSRTYDKCRWNLRFIQTAGALSSSNGKPSRIVARDVMDASFNTPGELGGQLVTDALQGGGAKFLIRAALYTASGRPSSKNNFEKTIQPGGSVNAFDLFEGGINRDCVLIEKASVNCHVVGVEDRSTNPPTALNDALKGHGLDVSGYKTGHEITVISMSYSGDSTQETKVRLDK